MSSKVAELFTHSTDRPDVDWRHVVAAQQCPLVGKRCFKVRKSQPAISIGTCTVLSGARLTPVMICPNRLLERNQIFIDALHLLSLHEPGNELHLVPEVGLPGGSIDYMLVSARNHDVIDFVGIELQTLDTTGTVWPERQRFLHDKGHAIPAEDLANGKPFGMNWKMTAKTILVQMHHKIQTFEGIAKHLVLVVQKDLYDYFEREFDFSAVGTAKVGNSMHFHAYSITEQPDMNYRISLATRTSTNAAGVARCVGQAADPSVDLDVLLRQLCTRISPATLLRVP